MIHSRLSLLLVALLSLIFLGACVTSQSAVAPDEDVMPPEPVDAACAYFYYSWARTAEFEGQLLEAQEAYSKALVCDENSQFLQRQLVHLLIAMGKKEKAAVILEALVASQDISNKTRLELAGIFENLGKTDNAVALLQESLEEDPDDAKSLLTLGYLYFRHDRLEEARLVLEEYMELEPESYSGAVMLAKLYRATGEEALAAKMYEKVLDLNWSMVQALDAADFFETMGDTERATHIYEKILDEGDTSSALRRKLVSLYLLKGDHEKAMAQLQLLRAEETIHPDRVDLAIGRVLLDQQKHKEAVDHFVKMVVNYPDMEIIRPLLALTYHQLNDDESALQVLADVAVDSPEFKDSVLMSVRIYQDAKQLPQAAAYLRQVLDDDKKKRVAFYYVLADIYRRLGKQDKSEAVFEEAIAFFPDNSLILFEYGLYMEKTGRPKKAMTLIQQSLKVDNDHALALNYVGYTWADQGVRLDEALDYINRAVQARPNDGFVRDSLGWVYYKMENYGRAVTELGKAVDLQPDDPTIHEHLGDAHLKLGAREEAIAAYKRSIALYKDAKKRAKVRQKLEIVKRGD